MRRSKNPSPARSVGTPRSGVRSFTSRGTRSEGTGAQSRNSLLALDVSLPQTSCDRESVLNDTTDVASTRLSGWWKKLEEPTIDMGAVFSNKMSNEIPFVEESEPSQPPLQSEIQPPIEELETSGNMTINSIVLPEKRLFTKKTKQVAAKFTEIQSRESAETDQNTCSDKIMTDTIYKPAKKLFSKKPIAKQPFLSFTNITAKSMNRTNFVLEPENNKKPIFGNKKKRNFNPFEGFVASDSENETIHAKVFAFQSNRPGIEAVRRQSRRSSVANSEVSSTSEFDFETTKNWKQLPSSTMMEIDPASSKNTPKKPRLTYDIAEEAGKDFMAQSDIDDEYEIFGSSKSLTKKSNASKEPDVVIDANKSGVKEKSMSNEAIKKNKLYADVTSQVNQGQVKDDLLVSTNNLMKKFNSTKETDSVFSLRQSATKESLQNNDIRKDSMEKLEIMSEVDHNQIENDYLSVGTSLRPLLNKSALKRNSQNQSMRNNETSKPTGVQDDSLCNDEVTQVKVIEYMPDQNINYEKNIDSTQKYLQTKEDSHSNCLTKDKTEQVEEMDAGTNHVILHHENAALNIEHNEIQDLEDHSSVGTHHISDLACKVTLEKPRMLEDIMSQVETDNDHVIIENEDLYMNGMSSIEKGDSLRSLPNKSANKEISQNSLCKDAIERKEVQEVAVNQVECDQENSIIHEFQTEEDLRNLGLGNRSTELLTITHMDKNVHQDESHLNCLTKDKGQVEETVACTTYVNLDHEKAATNVEHYETFHSKIIRDVPKNLDERSSVGSYHISDQSSKGSEWNSHDTQWIIRKSIRRMTRKSTLRSSLRTMVMAKSVDKPETGTLNEISQKVSTEVPEGTKKTLAVEDGEGRKTIVGESLQEHQETEQNNDLSKTTQHNKSKNQEKVNQSKKMHDEDENEAKSDAEKENGDSNLMYEQKDTESYQKQICGEKKQNNDLSNNNDCLNQENIDHSDQEQDEDENEAGLLQVSEQRIEVRDINLGYTQGDTEIDQNETSEEIVQNNDYSKITNNECQNQENVEYIDRDRDEDESETSERQESDQETEMREMDQNEVGEGTVQNNDLSKISNNESQNQENVDYSDRDQDEDESETSERQDNYQETEMRDSNLEYNHEDTDNGQNESSREIVQNEFSTITRGSEEILNYTDQEQDKDESETSKRQESEQEQMRHSNFAYEDKENYQDEISRETTGNTHYQEKSNRFFARGSEHNNDSSHFFGGESTINTAVETSTRPNKAKKQMPLEAYLKKLKDENMQIEQKMRKELEAHKPTQPDLNYHYVYDNFKKINRPSKPRAGPKVTVPPNQGRHLGDRATIGGTRASSSANQPNTARSRAREATSGHRATNDGATNDRARAGEKGRSADGYGILEGRYKPAKLFMPKKAPWVTKRLYKFLESKLEPRYGFMCVARAEKLARALVALCRELRARPEPAARAHVIGAMARELARLGVVRTHLDFYAFVEKYLSLDLVYIILPDVFNKLPLPPGGVYSDILPESHAVAGAL